MDVNERAINRVAVVATLLALGITFILVVISADPLILVQLLTIGMLAIFLILVFLVALISTKR